MSIMPPLYFTVPASFCKRDLQRALDHAVLPAKVTQSRGSSQIKVMTKSVHREKLVGFVEGWLACLEKW